MSSNATPITFFGYWSGQLPAVTELHFRSFLRHHPDSRYELWLDEDDASAIAAPELQWIRTHPRIAVRSFSLNRLIEQDSARRAREEELQRKRDEAARTDPTTGPDAPLPEA